MLLHCMLGILQVCNNRGECSCDVGFTGANCETPFSGPGGGKLHVYIDLSCVALGIHTLTQY